MIRQATSLLLFLLVMVGGGCTVNNYTPRTKADKNRHAPSAIVLNNIIEYRINEGSWPLSLEELAAKSKKYRESLSGFPYTYTNFKIKDSANMTFYFSGHVADQGVNKGTILTRNSYEGEAKFFKAGDRFIWKLKMY